VWERGAAALTRTVYVHVVILPRKLEEGPKRPELILTPGVGYKLAG
jgi:hypothetical protein